MITVLEEAITKLQNISEPTVTDWIGSTGSIIGAGATVVTAFFAWKAFKAQNERLNEQEKLTKEIYAWEKRRNSKELLKERKFVSKVSLSYKVINEINRLGAHPNTLESRNYKNIARIVVTIQNNSESMLYDITFRTSLSLAGNGIQQILAVSESPTVQQPFRLNTGEFNVEVKIDDDDHNFRSVYYDDNVRLINENSASISSPIHPRTKTDLSFSIDSTDLNNNHLSDFIRKSSIEFTDKNGLRWKRHLSGSFEDITTYPEYKD